MLYILAVSFLPPFCAPIRQICYFEPAMTRKGYFKFILHIRLLYYISKKTFEIPFSFSFLSSLYIYFFFTYLISRAVVNSWGLFMRKYPLPTKILKITCLSLGWGPAEDSSCLTKAYKNSFSQFKINTWFVIVISSLSLSPLLGTRKSSLFFSIWDQ